MTETASEVWGTAVLVFLVPLGLAIVHFIFPGSFQDAMVFDHSEFSTITLWTSAYVHLGVNHLLSNLLGYAVGLVPTWLLFAQQQRHRVFRRLLLVFVVGFPPLIAIGDYMIFQIWLQAETAATRGFSGVVAAIFGLLFAAVLEVVWARTSLRETFGIAASIGLLSMLGILIRGGPVPLDALTLGLIGVGLSLMLVVSLDALRQPVATGREYWVEFLLVLYCTAVLVVFLPGLFPIHWVQSGSVINIFGHATGLVLGFLAGIVAMHTTPRVTLGETTPM